jgi:hypothetical protein
VLVPHRGGASGCSKTERTRVANMDWAALGTRVSRLRMAWVRQRCQEAPSRTAAMAALRPSWASEITLTRKIANVCRKHVGLTRLAAIPRGGIGSGERPQLRGEAVRRPGAREATARSWAAKSGPVSPSRRSVATRWAPRSRATSGCTGTVRSFRPWPCRT